MDEYSFLRFVKFFLFGVFLGSLAAPFLSQPASANGCNNPVTYGPFGENNYDRCMAASHYPANRVWYCTPKSNNYGTGVTGFQCASCPDGHVCRDKAGNKSCAAGYIYNADADTCTAAPQPPTPEECLAENKLYDPLTQQCGEECAIGHTATLEQCDFTGCPSTHMTIGKTCQEYPPSCEEPTPVSVCNGSYCWCESAEENGCNPNHPQYVGTALNGKHMCDQPPPGCGPNMRTGYITANGETIQICYPIDNGNPTGDGSQEPCERGYVRINGDCQRPDTYQQDALVIGETNNSDGTKTTTHQQKRTVTDSNGNTKQITETTVKQYDSNGNLISEQTTTEESEGKEGSSVVGGGLSCTQEPECLNADAVQCEQLKELWRQRCDQPQFLRPEGGAFNSGKPATEAETAKLALNALIGDIKGEISDLMDFNLTSQGGGIPANEKTIKGVVVDFSWIKFASWLSWLGYIFIAVAWIKAFQIIMG